MYITYHKKVRPEGNERHISHEVLSNELKSFISERGVEQEYYAFYDNGYYFFLYLSNGDRIDCLLGGTTSDNQQFVETL